MFYLETRDGDGLLNGIEINRLKDKFGTKKLPTAELALNTMLISEGIYLSDRLGREVTAEEVRELSESTALRL